MSRSKTKHWLSIIVVGGVLGVIHSLMVYVMFENLIVVPLVTAGYLLFFMYIASR